MTRNKKKVFFIFRQGKPGHKMLIPRVNMPYTYYRTGHMIKRLFCSRKPNIAPPRSLDLIQFKVVDLKPDPIAEDINEYRLKRNLLPAINIDIINQ